MRKSIYYGGEGGICIRQCSCPSVSPSVSVRSMGSY